VTGRDLPAAPAAHKTRRTANPKTKGRTKDTQRQTAQEREKTSFGTEKIVSEQRKQHRNMASIMDGARIISLNFSEDER
jgi:hypothetical protein